MENYNLYNTTTMKSVGLTEDTTLIFELNKQKNTNVFLNTLLYQSRQGFPISISLLQGVNKTEDVGFGKGAVLDFMYSIKDNTTSITVTHPLGDEEIFEWDEKEVTEVEEIFNGEAIEQIDKYYYSTSSDSYVFQTRIGNDKKANYYVNGSFVARFEYEDTDSIIGNIWFPKSCSRNGMNYYSFVDIVYSDNKIVLLQSRKSIFNYCVFTYNDDRCNSFIEFDYIDDEAIQVDTICLTYYENGRLKKVTEQLNELSESQRKTLFKYNTTNTELIVENEITNDFSKIVLNPMFKIC